MLNRRGWADVKRFVVEHCEPTTRSEDAIAETVLYAHFRKRAFLADESAVSEGEFRKRLAKLRKPVGEHRGVALYALWPLNVIAPPKRGASRQPRARGEVELLVDVRFSDGTAPAGTVTTWQPSEKVGRVQVVWQGKRREIAADQVRRIV